jgi:tetratricopeptide (TPR) repeat protein
MGTYCLAQNPGDAQMLVTEGIALNNKKDYAGAESKYKAALNIDPENVQANYQMAFSLSAEGKGTEAIPYLQKVVKGQASAAIISSAYELMGSIYDKANQPQRAIDTYKEGIKANPAYQSMYYNLGLAYFRNKQYAEAENSAIEAIKLNPNHASSMRLYALVTFHQNKRAPALLGFCSFLMLEPNTSRSAEAYGNIQHIIQGGVLKPEPGAKPTVMDADTKVLNTAITQAVTPFAKRKYASAGELLTAQLKAMFTAIGAIAGKQTGNDFFRKYLAAYFYQLAQTPNMPAFARLVNLSAPESAQWAKNNAPQMAGLDNWVKNTERGF